MQWDGELSPRSADWNNVNFLLAEALRDKYDPVNIIHLEFRAIPETEHEYRINVEVIVPPPVQFHPIRTTLKKKRRTVDSTKVTKEGRFVIKAIDPFDGLTEDDRSFRESFNRLPLERRIRFWQKHVSPFFKAPARRS